MKPLQVVRYEASRIPGIEVGESLTVEGIYSDRRWRYTREKFSGQHGNGFQTTLILHRRVAYAQLAPPVPSVPGEPRASLWT